jgi:hypothetical protein
MSLVDIAKNPVHVIPPELQKPAPRLVKRRPGTLGLRTILGRVILVPATLAYLYLLVITAIEAWAKYRGRLPDTSWGKVFDSLGAAGVFVLIMVLPLYYICYIHYWLEKRLCRNGVAAVGRITDKVESKRYYELHYEFTHPNFGEQKWHVYVPFAHWKKAQVGEIVTILYKPSSDMASLIYEYGYFKCV